MTIGAVSAMHFKPLSMRGDGAVCGALRLPFTGTLSEVTCAECLEAVEKAQAEGYWFG